MPKRTRKSTEMPDIVQNAHRIVMESIQSTETSLTLEQIVMRQMGARGGKIGGKRRLETMTEEQRRRSARKAARARWEKAKNP